MQKAGRRPGRPPGAKNFSTLSKEAARDVLRAIVLEEMRELVGAQLANAKGLKYLVVRDKGNGKFLRVSESMAKLDEHEERIEVWEKDPSVQAFTDLMNRALDKPKEQEQDLNIRGTVNVVQILKQRHARLRGKSPMKMLPTERTAELHE